MTPDFLVGVYLDRQPSGRKSTKFGLLNGWERGVFFEISPVFYLGLDAKL